VDPDVGTSASRGGGADDGSVWVIVVAAGTGDRFGGPKQYAPLAGARVLDHALRAAHAVADGVVLVVAPAASDRPEPGADIVVVGGDTRSASVRCGLAAVPADAAVVLVHDAARPLASPALFGAVVDAVGADAVVPGVAVVDTLRDRRGGTVDRDALVAVQTPQGFRAAALRRAHSGGREATDDAGLVEAVGGTVVVVPGEGHNAKITDAADLVVAEAALTGPDRGVAVPSVRIGQGFDVHRLGDDRSRPLVLGGVRFDGPGLVGHSDGDVVAHACADALLGAAGLGDIGVLFPDTDPVWAGADSIGLLAEVARRVRADGWTPANVDCSVVLDAPKLAPRRQEMERKLTGAVGAPVSVKGRRTEGLGALGRAEGIVCFANALLVAADEPVRPSDPRAEERP